MMSESDGRGTQGQKYFKTLHADHGHTSTKGYFFVGGHSFGVALSLLKRPALRLWPFHIARSCTHSKLSQLQMCARSSASACD